MQRDMMEALQKKISLNPAPIILLGDLNLTPFSSVYKDFVTNTQLKNAMHGEGFFRTWSGHSKVLRLTIDHILYSGVEKKRFEVIGPFGSDHFALVADFSPVSSETGKKTEFPD